MICAKKELNTNIDEWFTSYQKKHLEGRFLKATVLGMLNVGLIMVILANHLINPIDWLNTVLSVLITSVLLLCFYKTYRFFARQIKHEADMADMVLIFNDLDMLRNHGASIRMYPHESNKTELALTIMVNDQALKLRESPSSELGWCWYDIERKQRYTIPMSEQDIAMLSESTKG